jgi:hypothetical protein
MRGSYLYIVEAACLQIGAKHPTGQISTPRGGPGPYHVKTGSERSGRGKLWLNRILATNYEWDAIGLVGFCIAILAQFQAAPTLIPHTV